MAFQRARPSSLELSMAATSSRLEWRQGAGLQTPQQGSHSLPPAQKSHKVEPSLPISLGLLLMAGSGASQEGLARLPLGLFRVPQAGPGEGPSPRLLGAQLSWG